VVFLPVSGDSLKVPVNGKVLFDLEMGYGGFRLTI